MKPTPDYPKIAQETQASMLERAMLAVYADPNGDRDDDTRTDEKPVEIWEVTYVNA